MTPLLGEVWLNPGHLIAWLAVGLIAGFLAGKIMGSGYGFLGDMILGLIGAVVGGWVVGLFITTSAGFVGSVVVSVIGAVLLIAIARMFEPGRRRTGISL
jgi:uncharacterized membrane protein YeaQ/YmgE (transglycosylase-associated protein family)